MANIKIARTVVIAAIAAARSPVVRAAIRNAPNLIPEAHRQAAFEGAKRAAFRAGEITARVIPKNRFF